MTLNKKMADLLSEIQSNEVEKSQANLAFMSPDIGDNLIKLYMKTNSYRTRELVTLFMIEAGYGWLRKLVTHDASTLVA